MTTVYPSSDEQVVVIYGAAGTVGSAVARAFAARRARVHLAGRTGQRVNNLANEIRRLGGSAVPEEIDVADPDATRTHADEVVRHDGKIDVMFNAVTHQDVQGTPLHELSTADVAATVAATVQSHMHTVGAVAPHMIARRNGVIQTMVGHGPPTPAMGSTTMAWQLTEAMYRQYACELGPHGIRVQWFRTGGFRESMINPRDYGSSFAGDTSATDLLEELDAGTMLGRLPSADEAGEFAVFAASDAARSLTAVGFNITAGAVAD